MAFYFNNATSNRFTLADHSALTMTGANNWCFSIWVKSDDRTGTIERPVFNWVAGGATTNWYTVSVGDASSSNRADDIRWLGQDDDGSTINMESSSNPFASNTSWTHLAFQLDGTTVSGYVNGSFAGYGSNAAFDDIDRSSSMKFGNGVYDNNQWKGSLAEWAFWNRKLSGAEITALAKSYSPDHLRYGLMAYIPMVRDYVEVINNIAITNNGSTVSTHPPMIYPSYTIIGPSRPKYNIFPDTVAASTNLTGDVSDLQDNPFT